MPRRRRAVQGLSSPAASTSNNGLTAEISTAKVSEGDEGLNQSDTDKPCCRVCFDHDTKLSPLVAPCKCRGTQEFVHVHCLKRWQQCVSKASQCGDERARRCGVCRAPYSIQPPVSAVQWLTWTLAKLAVALCVGFLVMSAVGRGPWLALAVLVLLVLAVRCQSMLLLLAASCLLFCLCLASRGLRLMVRMDEGGGLGIALVRYGHPIPGLHAGLLLVASQDLDHAGIFRRSVVLLTEHSERHGARGLLLTQALQPSSGAATAVASNAADAAAVAELRSRFSMSHFIGGPVQAPGRIATSAGHNVELLHTFPDVRNAHKLPLADQSFFATAGDDDSDLPLTPDRDHSRAARASALSWYRSHSIQDLYLATLSRHHPHALHNHADLPTHAGHMHTRDGQGSSSSSIRNVRQSKSSISSSAVHTDNIQPKSQARDTAPNAQANIVSDLADTTMVSGNTLHTTFAGQVDIAISSMPGCAPASPPPTDQSDMQQSINSDPGRALSVADSSRGAADSSHTPSGQKAAGLMNSADDCIADSSGRNDTASTSASADASSHCRHADSLRRSSGMIGKGCLSYGSSSPNIESDTVTQHSNRGKQQWRCSSFQEAASNIASETGVQAPNSSNKAPSSSSTGSGSSAQAGSSSQAVASPQIAVFHGYCSWAHGQLEGEIRSGAWGLAHVSAGDLRALIDANLHPDGGWQALVNTGRLLWY